MVIMMLPGLEISEFKGFFHLGSSWGNSDRPGCKLQFLSPMRATQDPVAGTKRCSFPSGATQHLPGGGGKH